MPTSAELREEITKQIIAAIESGKRLPWRKPWTTSPNAGRAANVVSKRPYTGINPLLLEIHRLKHGLSSRWYGTFRQWSDLGLSVKKRPENVEAGDWGTRIVFYRPVSKTKVDPATGDKQEDKFFLMRTYTVFSADQVNGAEAFQVTESEPGESVLPNFAPADELIEATEADIRHGGEQAFYHRLDDYIQLPRKHRFNPVGSYYETAFHELAHWSESRLGWEADKHGYAMNELVAEMSASFLATELGVPQGESLENHAAYLRSWLQAMKGDSSFIFKASTQASKVADYLLSFVGKEATAFAEEVVAP